MSEMPMKIAVSPAKPEPTGKVREAGLAWVWGVQDEHSRDDRQR
jgi:hypothetical protein